MRPIGGGEKRSRIDIQGLRGFAVIAAILLIGFVAALSFARPKHQIR